jgi:hypothetical protein
LCRVVPLWLLCRYIVVAVVATLFFNDNIECVTMRDYLWQFSSNIYVTVKNFVKSISNWYVSECSRINMSLPSLNEQDGPQVRL